MIYVKKMANRIRAHIFEGINNNIPDVINQIIADTKTACIKTIKKNQDEYKSTAYTKDSYIHDIKKVEIKER